MALCDPNPKASISDLLKVPTQFTPSQRLVISCGCMPIDPQARKIAILRSPYYPSPSSSPAADQSNPGAGDEQQPGEGDKVKYLVQLPKGRKNIGEDLLDAA
jgi:hypothetical protein